MLILDMLEFTEDIREAGLLYEEYGYKICALPVGFGKDNASMRNVKSHFNNFPATLLKPGLNIILNHYLSKTISIDVDDYVRCKSLFTYFDIDLDVLIQSTMTWQGQDNHFKLLYKKPCYELNLNKEQIYPSEKIDVFTFKGANLIVPVTRDNLNNYYDHLPPSIHPIVNRPYKFITRLYRYTELPEMPDVLLNLWKNFDQHKSFLLSKVS